MSVRPFKPYGRSADFNAFLDRQPAARKREIISAEQRWLRRASDPNGLRVATLANFCQIMAPEGVDHAPGA